MIIAHDSRMSDAAHLESACAKSNSVEPGVLLTFVDIRMGMEACYGTGSATTLLSRHICKQTRCSSASGGRPFGSKKEKESKVLFQPQARRLHGLQFASGIMSTLLAHLKLLVAFFSVVLIGVALS